MARIQFCESCDVVRLQPEARYFLGRGRTVNAVDCKSMSKTLGGSNPPVLKNNLIMLFEEKESSHVVRQRLLMSPCAGSSPASPKLFVAQW